MTGGASFHSLRQYMRRARQDLRLGLLRALGFMGSPYLRRKDLPLSSLGEESRILILRPDHLGDLLFATPALRALRKALPRAHIALMVGPWGQEIARRNPYVDQVLICEFPGFERRPKASPLAPYRKLLTAKRLLTGQRFDLAIVLRFDFWWGALLVYLAGIPRRLGYEVAECAPFLSQALAYEGVAHEVERNTALIGMVAGVGQPGPLEFWVREEDRAFAKSYLAARDVGEGEPVVSIHPGAGAPVKLWRNEAWAWLGDRLAQEEGVKILITGSANEEKLVQAIAQKMTTPPMISAGETGLGQLAALLERSALVIGPDSGPLHLAVALGVPTVHLYGPVDVRTFGPWGERSRHKVLVADMHCIPCNRLDYPEEELAEHPCVRQILEEEVLKAARTLLHEGEIQ